MSTESSSAVRTAACSCGQLRAVARGEPVRISMCHCLACQRRTGSVFGVQARFPRERVELEGRSSSWTRVGDSGQPCTYHFCPDCGAIVHYHLEMAPDLIAIPIGAFADPTFPAPKFSVYEARQHPWVVVPEGVEHHD